jgi:hypothetical protein
MAISRRLTHRALLILNVPKLLLPSSETCQVSSAEIVNSQLKF